MYVGERYTATAVVASRALFVCVHCKKTRTVMATGVGSASGNSPFFLDGSGARGRAGDGASDAAAANMSMSLRCATCPSCGKHDGAARARLYLTSAVIGLGSGALLGIVPVAADNGGSLGVTVGIIGGIVVALGVTFVRASKVLAPTMFEAE